MDQHAETEALQRGDEAAFRTLFDSYKDKVYNTLLGFTGSAADAEDLTQEVFIQVFESIRHFRGESKLSTWIYRIAVNKALMHRRSKQRKERWARMTDWLSFSKTERGSLQAFEHPGIQLERREQAAVLHAALQKLPGNQRTAWTLHKIEELSYEEIAEVMQTSLSSVESLMHRGKQNLKKYLNDYYANA